MKNKSTLSVNSWHNALSFLATLFISMSRLVCQQCHYPKPSCICHAVVGVNNRCKIWVLQHPHEVKQAKNTVRLLQLALNKIEVVVGQYPDDFTQIAALPLANTALLYPSEQARFLDEASCGANAQLQNLVVLDGTWKKTHRLLQQNPWLTQFQCVSFSRLPTNQYTIRKANKANSLSTLEAVAHSLHLIEQCPAEPLLHLLTAFIDKQTQHMSDEVKRRYAITRNN